MKRLTMVLPGFLTIFLVLAGLKLGYTEGVRGVTNDTVRVGLSLDLTGPTSTVQRPILEAVKNFFSYVNDQGGINGRRVKLIAEDDRYSIPVDMAVFKKFVFRDEVLGLILVLQEASINAILPQITKHKVPGVILSMNEGAVIPTKRYLFQPVASYRDQIKVLFDYIMKDLKAKNPRIAFIAPDNSYGKDGYAAAQESAKHYDLTIVDREFLFPGAIEAVSQVLLMKKANPDFVVSHNYVDNSIALLRDARKMKFSVPILGGAGSCSDDLVKIAGKAAENYIGCSPTVTWHTNTEGIKKMREIHKKYSPGTEDNYRTQIHILGWVTTMVFAEGLRQAGQNLTPDTFVNALETFKDFKTGDLSAPVTFGPDKHKGGESSMVFKADIEKGRLVTLTGWRKPSF